MTRGGGRGPDEALNDLDILGIDEGEIRDALEEDEEREPPFGVWPENTRTVELFLACRRQWTIGALGGYFGLRAEGVEAVFRMKRIPHKDQGELFDDLHVMAEAAMAILNAREGDDE